MRRTTLSIALLLLVGTLGFASRASATPFDLIYTDRLDVSLCSNGCGITLSGTDFALLVNTGATSLTEADLSSIVFHATSSQPEVELFPIFNFPGPPLAPVLPHQALGSVHAANGVLVTRLLPGETHRNTAPLTVLTFEILRPGTNTYAGPVTFQVEMLMGADVAHFTIVADVHLADHAISFPSAARVSSTPLTTPSRPTTWGKIKALYR